jgi:voltage-gated potassium channel
MRRDRRLRDLQRQLIQAVLVLVAVVAAGTAGYMLLEGWRFRTALFMSVTTVTTVGYTIPHELSVRGEYFTIALVIAGTGAGLYTLNAILRIAMEGELTGALAERRMRRRVEHMRDHVILCGYGRVGEEVARELRERNQPLVIIERDPDSLARAEAAGCDHVHGDATRDEALKRAGIERARCLISALDSDADNSWVVLTARGLNADLWIVARADHPESEPKLKQAGANRVITPASLAGSHMALAAVQPLVLDFTRSLVRSGGSDLLLAQVAVDDASGLVGLRLADALDGQQRLTVLGVRHADGNLLVQPDPGLALERGDELIILGRVEDLEQITSHSLPTGTDRRTAATAEP